MTAFTVVVHGKILIYCTSTYNAKLYSSFSSYLYFYHASTTKTIISFINIWNYIRWEFMTQGQRKCFFLKSVVIKMSFFYQGHVYARVCLHQAMTHVHLFMWTVYVRVFMTKKVPKVMPWLFACCLYVLVCQQEAECVERFSLPDTMKNAAEESLLSSLPHPNFNIHEWYITAS